MGKFKTVKKANVLLDGGIYVVMVVFVVIGIMWLNSIFSDLNDDVQASDDISTEGKKISQQQKTNFNLVWDTALLAIFIGLWFASIISSFYVDTNPVFFIISIVLLLFLLFLSMIVGNVYEDVVGDSLTAQVAQFPKMNFILTHILQFMIAIGFSIAIALFAKPKNE